MNAMSDRQEAYVAEILVQHLVVDGVRSLVRSVGSDSASEAVVLLHGNPGSSEDWLFLMAEVGALARVIAPDMPAYGHAERPVQFDYTIPGYARHLAGLLEQLAVTRVHLVMHDFGGPWGLQWASEHPAQVASITLVNVGLMPGYRWHTIARIWRTPVVGELFQLVNSRRDFRKGLNGVNPKPFPDAFLDRMYDSMDSAHRRAVLALYRASDLDQFSQRVGPLLKPLALPALVLWGAEDTALPVRFAELQQDYFQCETHLLEHCGHWPMVDNPERVKDLIVAFLQRTLARER
jgi:pimeloyl-ACP methyl ester carboxylesterase